MISHLSLGQTAIARRRKLIALIRKGEVTLGGYGKGKIYGTLDCSAGKRMNVDNRMFFEDEAEAIKEGFRPCARCLPGAYKSWKASVKNKAAMISITDRLNAKAWNVITEALAGNGFTLINGVLSDEECDELIADYNQDDAYRKVISMERYRFGLGEYKYFQYPLPPLITNIRQAVYEMIAPVANNWMQALNIQKVFPKTLEEFQRICHASGQTKPTILILKYGEGGFNTLHQDLYGDIYFPLQAVLFLSEPGEDYTGGEFVLTEQIPRAQSKVNVLTPKRGDMIIFTTAFRPVKGTKGFYRVNMKHGVSPLHSGSRYTLGIIFHDALS